MCVTKELIIRTGGQGKGQQGRPVNEAFSPPPDHAGARVLKGGTDGGREGLPPRPPGDQTSIQPCPPLRTNPQASAVSDSNTGQRQNTQVHEDTKTPRGGHAKTTMRRAEGGAPERAPPPREGVTPPIKNRNPQSLQNHPAHRETF